MAVKKLDKRIAEAFMNLGFSEEEITEGCWLLERGGKGIAWIALHKFLERVAQRANIVFDMPQVLNCQPDEVAVCVSGRMGQPALKIVDDKASELVTALMPSAWSIGEASSKNCKNEYRWAMAEKRAKDRVILKLLGIAGDMYSEEEADEFKKKPEKEIEQFEQEAKKETTAITRSVHKAMKDGTEWKKPSNEQPLDVRYEKAIKYLEKQLPETFADVKPSVKESLRNLIADLSNADMDKKAVELNNKMMSLTINDDEIKY